MPGGLPDAAAASSGACSMRVKETPRVANADATAQPALPRRHDAVAGMEGCIAVNREGDLAAFAFADGTGDFLT